MNNVLGTLKDSIAFPYIDDVIIPCPSTTEGLEHLRQVRKVQAVREMKEPQNIKGVRQFLGLSGYFRRHVENYARIVEPLTRLVRKDTPWCRGSEQQSAFDNIKTILTERPVLAVFDPELETELHTDASSLGYGAILMQRRGELFRVVAYYSKQSTREQKYYHSYELETLAVVSALRYFRVYLIGIKFRVVTDCSALRTTFAKKDLLPRVARWWLEVQDYTFEITYRAGAKMSHVDTLSRQPLEEPELNQADLTEGDWILAAQLQDEQIVRIRTILSSEEKSRDTKSYFDDYVLKNDRVYRKLENGKTSWVVPKDVRWQVCRLCHDQAGHTGIENTLKRMQKHYWFARMRSFVTKYVRACLNCAYYKQCTRKKQGKLHPIEKVSVPFHTVHVDHVGLFETSAQGNKFILVIVDAFTKFVIMEAVKSQKTQPVVRVFQQVMCLFGVPTRIISDRGSAFTSHSFKLFCETYNIRHVLNAVATPRANGQCERYNRTIVAALTTLSADTRSNEWDTHVKEVQSAMNTTFNKGIKTTPSEALMGYQPRPAAQAQLLAEIEVDLEHLNLAELRAEIQEHITTDQARQKQYYDKHRREADKYSKDDLVLVLITSTQNSGSSKKLLPKFRGAFRVVAALFNDRYVVEDLREGRYKSRTVVAVEKLRPWTSAQV
jgi:hypothetical protein